MTERREFVVKKTVGSVLKERRTQLNWSLDTAEKRTRIKKIYISALETDNHSALPGKFYVRAYLKQYSDKLKIDTNAILDAFDKGEMVDVGGTLEDTGNYRFIRPNERLLERSVDTGRKRGSNDTMKKGKFRYYLPIISLSITAIGILGIVIAIVMLSRPKDKLLLDNYTISSSSVSSSESSSSSLKQSTVLSAIENGNTLTVAVTSDRDSVVLDFALNDDKIRTAISLTNSNVSALMLSSDNSKATATINTGAAQSMITLGLANTTLIKINDQTLPLAQSEQPITTIILEMIYPDSSMSTSNSLTNENE